MRHRQFFRQNAAHWNLGRRIARERLHEKAGYHNSILRDVSVATGMATRTLQYAVRLHRTYAECPKTMLTLRHSQVLVDCPNADQRAHYEALAIQLRIDVGFEMSRNGRFRLAAVDCPELPTPEGRRARDFVYKCLLRAKTIVVKTQRTDLHGRYVTQLAV